MRIVAVAGIGTDVGKTVASAVLVHALKADYWKPVQTGSETDSQTISMLKPEKTVIFPEAYHFAEPASPHYAAALENEEIDPEKIIPPSSENLVIETAGGVLVPLNNKGFLNADLLERFACPVFVVTKHYLGSINHTLLTISELKRRNIQIAALIVSGEKHIPSESVYAAIHPEITQLHLPRLAGLTRKTVSEIAETWKIG